MRVEPEHSAGRFRDTTRACTTCLCGELPVVSPEWLLNNLNKRALEQH